ncbi:MAG: hypothetical protein AAGC63_15755 [Propionicimonas sp.]|nr:hypothetical protein [Propionicimonas sp.]
MNALAMARPVVRSVKDLVLSRSALRVTAVVLGAGLVSVLAAIGLQHGWVVLGVVCAVLATPVVLWWAARRHLTALGCVVLTAITGAALIMLSSSRWAGTDPGLVVMTPVLFALAAPAGAAVIAERRTRRLVTVAVVDVALLAVAAVGPAAPSFLPLMALAALGAPLAWQGWKR